MIQTPMQQRTLRVLEFIKLREMLASKALTAMGAERCRALEPSYNLAEVQIWQQETEEATVILQYLGGHPMIRFEDVRPQLALADKGATLSTRALLNVAEMLRASRYARDALVTDRENTPHLQQKAQGLAILRHLEDDITSAVGDLILGENAAAYGAGHGGKGLQLPKHLIQGIVRDLLIGFPGVGFYPAAGLQQLAHIQQLRDV